jgi:hypothetical protein
MELLNQLLQALLGTLFSYIHDLWQWCAAQILAVPWDRFGDLPGSKVTLLLVSASVVAYFLFRAVRELVAAGQKAFSAFVTLISVFMKTVPPILIAGLAAAAGAWVVNHVQL